MQKIEVHLGCKNGVDTATFQDAVIKWCEGVAALLPDSRYNCGLRLPGNPIGDTAHGDIATGARKPADAIVEIQLADADQTGNAMNALRSLGTSPLASMIDAGQSFVHAGEEHRIVPPRGPVFLSFPLTRLDRMTRDEFQDYWLNVHADYGRRMSPSYRQFHTDDALSRKAADAAGLAVTPYDGIAESFFADVAGLRALLTSPDVSTEAIEDEQRFIDHARSVIGFYETRAGNAD